VKALPYLLAVTAVLASGCAADPGMSSADAAPTATVTATVTVTETVTAVAEPTDQAGQVDLEDLVDQLDELDATPGAATVAPRPPKLELTVFSDGCGVIRSRPAAGTTYDNLTWTFLDQDGFQVLGRNAEGETRYRYFQGGTYAVVLEAFVDGAYRPVSNKVTVTC
jgi:hypothetical protein